MSRPLSLLVLLASPALLVACGDGKSTLLSAKPGECYSVVGRDSAGLPRMAKIPCASQQAALSCPPAAAAAPACPGVEATGAGHKAVSHKSTARRTGRRAVSTRYARYDDRVARSGEVVRSLGIDYARVDSDLLLGGSHAQSQGYARSYEREESGYREERREEHYAPPPPPPPPAFHAREKRVERSYSSSESSSYSAYGSSSGGIRRGCDCDGPGGRASAPHSAFDAYGYVTWRGKTPG